MLVLKDKCPYCFAKLASDGFCSRVCKMGALKRRQAELDKSTKNNAQEGKNNL